MLSPIPGRAAPTYLIDARVQLEPGARELERGTRLHVHHGTSEAPARVVPLGGGFAQLRLESPLVAVAGDRFVLRQIAPPDTIGGGTVMDAAPRKHGASDGVVERLQALERGDAPPARERAGAATGAARAGAARSTSARCGSRTSCAPTASARARTASWPRPRGSTAARPRSRMRALEHAGHAVRVGPNLHFHAEPLATLTGRVIEICERDGAATIAGVRDELGTSRRYAQALLEHLDGEKVTRREGDAHVLRRRLAPTESSEARRSPTDR